MRRISPSTLRQRVLPPVFRRVLNASPTTTRSLKTSTSLSLPRSTSTRRTFVAASNNSAHEEPHHHHLIDEIPQDSGDASEEPRIPPSDEESLYDYATSVIHPTKPSSSLPVELGPALTHLSTSFLPGNQHLAESASSPYTSVISFPDASGRPRTEPAPQTEEPESSHSEAVLALSSPFEGGEAYVADAVKRLANELNADVVRLDLVLGLGLDGLSSPLGSKGHETPSLPLSLNPLHLPAPQPLMTAKKEVVEEDNDDQHGMGGGMFGSMPIAVVSGGGGGMMPPGLGGLPGLGMTEEDIPQGRTNREWVEAFTRIINAGQSQPGKKRIIVLESAIAMSKTFPIWWSSLVEAVQRRRKGVVTPVTPGRAGKGPHSTTPEPSLIYPTTIVLQCTPSLALPHTAATFASAARDEDGSLREEEEALEELEEEDNRHMDPAQAAVAAIEEKLKSMGISVHSHVEVVKPRGDAKLWWGSEESDLVGRKEGDKGRLDLMLSKGVSGILPSFGSKTSSEQKPANPLRRLLMNRFSVPSSQQGSTADSSLVWKAYPVIPQHRNFGAEREARIHQRRVWTAALMQRAIYQLGGVLINPSEIFTTSEITGRPLTRKTESSGFGKGWGNAVVSWKDASHIASIALGTAARSGQVEDGVIAVKWQDIIRARKAMGEEKQIAAEQIKRHLPSPPTKVDRKTKSDIENAPQTILDPVVEQLKKSKSLNQHEKRLLPCIVDPNKLASTSFKDVHLPEKTVDGIRSMVSLPLLFPEAFRGGVLKDHATTGALLFGPPGTGKTLLARAVAAESGARMLAIQPSDVNDMYVGEGEKLVKAVFNLARRLSPCVVFLDEVDALFGARISRGSAGSMSHNLLLTEFMQEMDGLSSAIANKDKRVVVIGATNRPFDLDDAVLRRLPRRLLVDLPNAEGRKAILEILLRGETLSDDVDLERLSKETDGFSGSDLKHLCVSAALAAVKDTVQVPWAKNASSEAGAATPFSPQSSTRPGGASEPQVLVFGPTDGGGGGRKKAQVKRQKSVAPVAGPSRAMLHTTASAEPTKPTGEEGVSSLEGDGEGDQQISQGEVDELLSANKVGNESSSEDIVDEENNEIIEDLDIPAPKPRVVAWKHFKIALEEIRPSSSEEGSLPELRKWSEQFGEGGTRKGKKSGFGKGFGFGDEKPKDRDSGHGKVKQDDD